MQLLPGQLRELPCALRLRSEGVRVAGWMMLKAAVQDLLLVPLSESTARVPRQQPGYVWSLLQQQQPADRKSVV